MAVTLDDVLRRRVPVSFRHADGGTAVAPDVGALMADVLGWDPTETDAAVERYRSGIADERRRRGLPAARVRDDAAPDVPPKRTVSSS
jgi:glycerol-3-phosphate dehydrogenase